MKILSWSRPRQISSLRISIATKLILGFLLIIITISALFIAAGIQTISNRITAEGQEKVRNDLNAAREIYLNRLERVTGVIRLTANRYLVREALLSGNLEPASEQLNQIRADEQLDVLTITDKDGVVLIRTSNPSVVGDNKRHDELVNFVILNQKPISATSLILGDDLQKESPLLAAQAYIKFIDTPRTRPRMETEESTGMMLKAAAPIFDQNNNLIGVAYGGVLLNQNYEIVDKVKQTVYEDVKYKGQDIGTATIFQDDVRISTNVHNEDGSRAIGTRIQEEVYDQVIHQGERWIGRAYVVNNWYITAYEPIRDSRNRIVGILYVGVIEQKYLDIQKETILTFLTISLVGILITMLAAYFIATRISIPIQKLVLASNEVAQGNLNAKVELNTNDEFHSLADSFNAMSEALKKRDEQIKEFATKKIMEAERLALVGQLSANVAHELNNPLQGIVTFSHLLLEEHICDNKDHADVLKKIVVQADRCKDIIRGLLDFSRQRKPDKTICNLNFLIENCVSLLEKQALFHNIKIVKNLQGDLPMTVVDPSQIERVFINLIVNAADAMDGNGQLTLITFFDAKNVTIEVDIKDTGCGIREENMDKLFDPFFTTKDVGHGTGLGLAISYGIVKSHKGNILVKSKEGKGSTFTIVLPVAAIEEGVE